MAGLITSSIPAQNFELIRDKIGEILVLELANQYTLDNNYPNITKVWVERFIPFDANTALPTVNVSIAKTEFDLKTQIKQNGTTTYNIDIYTTGVTTPAGIQGDQAAMMLMNKIAGMIRAILMAPVYNTLGYTDGRITHTSVEGFFVGDKRQVKDALSDVVGRVIFTVRAVESNIITAVPVPLEQATTTIKLNESEFGFYYDFNPVV